MQVRQKERKQEKGVDYLVFDCETDSFDGSPVEPFIWGWIKSTGERGITYSKDEFINMLRDFDGIALAHNGGKFDTLLLSEYFEKGEIKLINSRVAEVRIGKARVRDSFLIIPAPLSASGLKDDFDYKILDRNKKHLREIHKQKIERYLMQDCVALFELVKRFYDAHGQRLTQAGAALKTWEKTLNGKVRRWGGAHDKHFRQFYYGGRCEAFKKGSLGDGWLYYDIKSSYPFAMAHEHTASHLNEYHVYNKLNKITPQSFVRVIAESNRCLPSRGKYNTEYPAHTDRREYFATGWEVLAGLETNTLKIHDATVYYPPFLETLKPYTDKFYAEKLAAEKSRDKVGRLIAKIFQNSLYGKYGTNADDYKKYLLVDAGQSRDGFSLHAEVGELDIIQRPDGGQFFDVALAASVTGFARSYLFRQMLQVKDLAYTDTDSIICRGGEFDTGENLGQWERVCRLDYFHVAGKKLYAGYDSAAGEWVTAHKGFSKLDTSHNDVIRAANGEQFIVNRSAPSINVCGKQNFINRTMRKT